MKLSILTATYNRGNLLPRLYESIVKNLIDDMDVEWLIMDDGSSDNTESIVSKFKEYEKIKIKYFKQENKGKMQAINNLTEKANGNLIIECDSDDFFTPNALKKVYKKYRILQENKNLYALVFLKNEDNETLSGNKFPFEDKDTTMFELYYRYNLTGEKIVVYKAEIRKKYKYKIEKNEKFSTEARLHHEIDLKYKVRCYNDVIVEGKYNEDGYTKNISKTFFENPKGYFMFFKEILEKRMNSINFKKRIYVIKHYILFSTLTGYKICIKDVKSYLNKVLLVLLMIPGKIRSKQYIKKHSLSF